ncbi:MAG: hypothetical protein H7Z40_20800 [Phycisphaerae bacterium]|nr:hypothetical protein [Gemmatimonadaceae bacterium]
MKFPVLVLAGCTTLFATWPPLQSFPHNASAPTARASRTTRASADIIRDVAPGGGALVVKADGSVLTWGRGWNGAMQFQVPTSVELPGRAVRAAVGGSDVGQFTAYVVLEDGGVVAWGSNDEGQLGNGTAGANVSLGTYPKPSATPVGVTGLNNIVAVTAGDKHALALGRDGTVWAWGRRGDGTIGDGDALPKGSLRMLSAGAPVQVPGLRDIVQIASGRLHNLALTRDGRVFAWGRNKNGELGNNTRINAWTPIPIPGLDHIISISAGNGGNETGVSGAVRDDGTVWTWGSNLSLMIGNSASATQREEEGVFHGVPEQVRGLTNAKHIRMSFGHVAVILADSSLRMWGYNGYSQIGLGRTDGDYVLRPTRVPALSGVTSVHLGTYRSYAVTADGSLWVWGLKHTTQGTLSRSLNVPTRLELP